MEDGVAANSQPGLVQLFRHNAWANDVMLDACRPLDDEQLATETAGTYGGLAQTLVHLAYAQGGYLTTLSGWKREFEMHDHRFPGVDRIAAHLQFTGCA